VGKAPGIGFDHSPPSGIEVVGRTPITMAVYRDRVTGVAACHGLEVTEIESRWQARISAPFQTVPGSTPPPDPCTKGTRCLSGDKVAGA